MLYSSYRGAGGTFRGKTWKLPNGYWRSCNHNGQQCTFKIYNEALKFSKKGKKLNEVSNTSTRLRSILGHNLRFTLVDKAPPKIADKIPDRGWDIWISGANVVATNANAWQAWTVDGRKLGSGRDLQFDPSILEGYQSAGARMQSHYMPELSRREMSQLASDLVKQGYDVKIKGPNLVTDAPEEQIQAAFGPGMSEVNEGRVKSYYMPELRKREIAELAARLVKNGYKGDVRGPNLRTDAAEKYVRSLRTMYPDPKGIRKKIGWSHGSKSVGEQRIGEAKSSFTLHAMGNGWSHSKTISANSQREAETMFRQDPRFRKEARQAGEKWKEVPIVGDREARSKFGKTIKAQPTTTDRSAFLSRTKGPPASAPQHYPPSPAAGRRR